MVSCFLLDEVVVNIIIIIGFKVKKLLVLDCFIFVFDMSYGVLLCEVKIVFLWGVELVGIGICSGEGGMLLEE